MPTSCYRYQFRQSFRVPAPRAFEWCTDFGPGDAALFSEPTRRGVRHLSETVVLLTDVTHPGKGRRTIRRLVRIDPELRAWTNTHLDGPFSHSQFWYRIVSDGPSRCHLDFVGLKVVRRARTLSATERARAAAADRGEDSRVWRESFAPALEAECAAPRATARARGSPPRGSPSRR